VALTTKYALLSPLQDAASTLRGTLVLLLLLLRPLFSVVVVLLVVLTAAVSHALAALELR
jgi:hypothetical protein